jgi:hypothetical protein
MMFMLQHIIGANNMSDDTVYWDTRWIGGERSHRQPMNGWKMERETSDTLITTFVINILINASLPVKKSIIFN